MAYTVSDCKPDVDSLKRLFRAWYNAEIADTDCPEMQLEEVYVVWFCYIVGNSKALISTSRPDHMYYELTYHQDKKQVHIDAYKKFKHDDVNLGQDTCEHDTCTKEKCTKSEGFDIIAYVG